MSVQTRVTAFAAAVGADIKALLVAVGNKVDKVSGKQLSANDFTTTEKNKLADAAVLSAAQTFAKRQTFGAGVIETHVSMSANSIDLALGSLFSKTISTASTLTVTSVPASGLVASLLLDLTNGGSAQVTWWAGIKWAGGTAPALTAAGLDSLGFYTKDGGLTWIGLLLGKDIK